MSYRFSRRSLQALQGVHPYLVHVMCEAIKTSPVDFTITDGLRTTEEQKALYAQGRTRPGQRVTNADGVKNLSNHQDEADGFKDGYGSAVDLCPYVNGRVDVNDTGNNLPKIAKHIKQVAKKWGYNIEWGGDWKNFVDKPHFQLK